MDTPTISPSSPSPSPPPPPHHNPIPGWGWSDKRNMSREAVKLVPSEVKESDKKLSVLFVFQ